MGAHPTVSLAQIGEMVACLITLISKVLQTLCTKIKFAWDESECVFVG